MTKTAKLFTALGMAVGSLFAYGAHMSNVEKKQGQSFLEDQGLTNVEGGETITHFNACGGEYSREYTATGSNGEQVLKAVCFDKSGKGPTQLSNAAPVFDDSVVDCAKEIFKPKPNRLS